MSNRSFEGAVSEWFADGSDRTPPAAIDAVLFSIRTIPQERALRVPRRFRPVPTYMRLAAVAALVAVTGAGAVFVAGGLSNPPPVETISPTSSALITPSPTEGRISTQSWPTFTSSRYGYETRYPAGWEATPASRDWVMDVDRSDLVSPARDRFIDAASADQTVIDAFAVDLLSGVSGDEWIDAYLDGTSETSGCAIRAADMPTIRVGARDGKLVDQRGCGAGVAFVLVEPRMYVFTIRRENQVPLLTAFLSNVHINAGAAGRLYVGDWRPYTSTEYDIALGVPPGWAQVRAIRAWTYEDDGGEMLTPAVDTFAPDGDDVRVRVSTWFVPFEGGAEPEQTWANVEAWIEAYCPRTSLTPCEGIAARAEHLCVESRDCHPGLLVPFDNALQAFFFGGVAAPGGMTIVSVWGPEDAADARYGGARHLIEGFLETMSVWPEDRKAYEVGEVWPPPTPEAPGP